MEPYGDPEARIRDLERPLADRAQSNELGTQPYEAPPTPSSEPYQYVPPPPPPPSSDPYQAQPYGQYGSQYGTPQYSSPYYSAPQQVVHKRSSTTALWLIPLIVGGIIAAGVAAIVLYFNTADPDTYSFDPSPSISGGGGPLDTPAPPVGIPPIDPEDQVITVQAGGSVSVSGVEKNQTIVCNGGTVSVSGVENVVEIQGSCGVVSVSGMKNIITVETAQTISASGFENRVTYRSGEPQITNSGPDNVVEQG